MSKVMGEIRAIDKTQRNQQRGYAFRGIDDVFNALQPVLVRSSIAGWAGQVAGSPPSCSGR
jgi:hypothetical protein